METPSYNSRQEPTPQDAREALRILDELVFGEGRKLNGHYYRWNASAALERFINHAIRNQEEN